MGFSTRHLILILSLFLIIQKSAAQEQSNEFRGVWIATVNNIDWPSSPDLSVEQQQKEFIDLLNIVEKFNLNTVILQVRPAADAFYRSVTEPWSWFLTGKQGKAPTPIYDPLAWAIEQCHQRGLELHAWFNPFRVRNNGFYPLSPGSFAAKHPQYIINYDNKLFFDPGYPQVQEHLVKVILEVVKNYDIDAVHLDDYFYPYPVRGKAFPDQKSFAKNGKSYAPNRLKDWRRNNINQFIRSLHDSIKIAKSHVKLGISPFGVWRNIADDPNGSPGAKGMSSYDDLYADVRKWLKEDWIDYVIPQLYWEQGNRYGDFLSLAGWWNKNCFGKPLYIGQAVYKSTDPNSKWNNPKEIGEQIGILRDHDQINGFAFYSISHLKKLSSTQANYLAENFLHTKSEPHDSRRANNQTNQTKQTTGMDLLNHAAADLTITEELVSIPMEQPEENSELTVAEKISLKKTAKGWMLSWKTNHKDAGTPLKFAIVTYQQQKDGQYLKKIYAITENLQYFIPRTDQSNFKNKLISIVVSCDDQRTGNLSKLFLIKGRKIKYN